LRADIASSEGPTPSWEPLVSVIVPNWNGEQLIRPCLASLVRQRYPNIEIIVVDDASTDRSPTTVAQEFPEALLVRRPRNGGFARAANDGMRSARGEVIALLNSDAVADPGWIAAVVDALSRYPRAGAIASKMVRWDRPAVINSVGDVFLKNGMPDSRGIWETDTGQYEIETEVFGASGGAAAYRRAMLDDIGLFDERFFMYCEDIDLAFRAQLRGYRCVYMPSAIVHHRMGATGPGERASFYSARNTLWLLARDVPWVVWRHHGLAIVTRQLTLALHSIRHARERAARARLYGQLIGLLGMPRFAWERRQLGARRRVTDRYVLGLLT
jgi:GT2 family glycosyltransferase